VIRILLLVLFLPFFILRFLFKMALALVVLPFALLVLFLGLAVVLVGVFIPLLPIAFVVFCVWAVARLASPTVLVSSRPSP
jgi:hypothetical protein